MQLTYITRNLCNWRICESNTVLDLHSSFIDVGRLRRYHMLVVTGMECLDLVEFQKTKSRNWWRISLMGIWKVMVISKHSSWYYSCWCAKFCKLCTTGLFGDIYLEKPLRRTLCRLWSLSSICQVPSLSSISLYGACAMYFSGKRRWN